MMTNEFLQVQVPPAEWMDSDTFVKHFNLRHADSLGGMKNLPPKLDEGVEAAYRAFHRRLHDVRVDLAHDHSLTAMPDGS